MRFPRRALSATVLGGLFISTLLGQSMTATPSTLAITPGVDATVTLFLTSTSINPATQNVYVRLKSGSTIVAALQTSLALANCGSTCATVSGTATIPSVLGQCPVSYSVELVRYYLPSFFVPGVGNPYSSNPNLGFGAPPADTPSGAFVVGTASVAFANPFPSISTVTGSGLIDSSPNGAILTVTGQGFVAPASPSGVLGGCTGSVFSFNGAAIPIISLSNLSAIVHVPPNLLIGGPGSLSVTNAGPSPLFPAGTGTSSISAPVLFMTPTVTTVSGINACTPPPGGVYALSVIGSGFSNTTTATWDGVPRTFTKISQTQATVQVPASAIGPGTHQLRLTNPSFMGTGGQGPIFTYTPYLSAVRLDSISPQIINQSTTTVLSVTGDHFVAGVTKVRWNGSDAGIVTTVLSCTALTATIPASIVATVGCGTVDLSNQSPNGGGLSVARFVGVYPGTTGPSFHDAMGFTSSEDAFGRAIAAADADSDGKNDLVVGAPNRYVNGVAASGDVMVYSSSTGLHVRSFGPGAPNTGFGSALAVGDVDADGIDDVAVGIPFGSNNGVAGTGGVAVYRATDGQSVRAFNGSVGSQFGASVAIGDVNGDGFDDVVVGAPYDSALGAVYVYSGATGSQIHAFNGGAMSSGSANPRFGASLAVADVNGDGRKDVSVGCPGGFSGMGGYRVFDGLSGAIIATSTLHSGMGGEFGYSLAAVDWNGDGLEELLVGSPNGANNGILGMGGAAVIEVMTGAQLFGVNGVLGSRFGHAVAAAGDVNGDGFQDLTIGAPRDNSAATESGSAFTYLGPFGILDLANSRNGSCIWDALGSAVVSLGDVDGDGRAELAATALTTVDASDPFYLSRNRIGKVEILNFGSTTNASWQALGIGCGPGPTPPTLSLSGPPIIGQSVNVYLGGAIPARPGFLLISPLAAPSDFGLGCIGWIDLSNFFYFDVATDSIGGFLVALPIPNLPGLAGLSTVFQAAMLAFVAPYAVELSNGVYATVG